MDKQPVASGEPNAMPSEPNAETEVLTEAGE